VQYKLFNYILLTIIFASLFFNDSICQNNGILLPVTDINRASIASIQLTPIGAFGIPRKPRPGVPGHLHTGIDMKRPIENYIDEPIFAIATGVVISMRNDGPYGQIIIEHKFKNGNKFWTVYEHVSGVRISVEDSVSATEPIARFMNRHELNRYGWQFDHFHFEILKIAPRPLKPKVGVPYRFFGTYNLECYNQSDLNRYYIDPIAFFENHLHE
jgi:murein DD-endopeptidase MepM/ murein hydrolase activator NlpD